MHQAPQPRLFSSNLLAMFICVQSESAFVNEIHMNVFPLMDLIFFSKKREKVMKLWVDVQFYRLFQLHHEKTYVHGSIENFYLRWRFLSLQVLRAAINQFS